jgi:hypothetical protein
MMHRYTAFRCSGNNFMGQCLEFYAHIHVLFGELPLPITHNGAVEQLALLHNIQEVPG